MVRYPVVLVPGYGSSILMARYRESGATLQVFPRLLDADTAVQHFLMGR
ncbi:hypothetical protein KIPB_013985, partial [Kipferlia bialata]|eukprot:g13985.t1